jgi:hypothetical protein
MSKQEYEYSDLIDKIDYKPGDYHKNLLKVLKFIDPTSDSSYSKWKVGTITESLTPSKCCCGHTILYRCQAIHRESKKVIIIGSKCFKNFLPNKNIEKEINKKLRKAKDPSIVDCSYCKKTVSKPIVEQQKNKKKKYHKKCLVDKFGKCYNCEKIKLYDCLCPLKETLKFGKYKGQLYSEMIKTPQKLSYLGWLFKNTKNEKFKNKLKYIIRYSLQNTSTA